MSGITPLPIVKKDWGLKSMSLLESLQSVHSLICSLLHVAKVYRLPN